MKSVLPQLLSLDLKHHDSDGNKVSYGEPGGSPAPRGSVQRRPELFEVVIVVCVGPLPKAKTGILFL